MLKTWWKMWITRCSAWLLKKLCKCNLMKKAKRIEKMIGKNHKKCRLKQGKTGAFMRGDQCFFLWKNKKSTKWQRKNCRKRCKNTICNQKGVGFAEPVAREIGVDATCKICYTFLRLKVPPLKWILMLV